MSFSCRGRVAAAALIAVGCGAPPRAAPGTPISPDSTALAAASAAYPASSGSGAPAPTFVWVDSTGEGRAQVVWFRRDLELTTSPASAAAGGEASLHLFASSRYLLFVNGAVVASGPARAYPQHPEFDSIDLRPHLVAGRNRIAVQVLSFGTASFQLRRSPGAFAAWGAVRDGAVAHDLATPGAWRCARDRGYDEAAPRMSFAMPPIEVYDARQALTDFLAGELRGDAAATPGWSEPLALAAREVWGELQPRSIPPLTAEWIAPKQLRAAFALDDSEQLLSFRVLVPDASRAEYGAQHLLFARTQIFSPRAQRVPFGLWWGSYFVNGKGPLESAGPSPGQRNRNLVWVTLRAGWNDFFVRYKSVFGSWDFYLATPRAAGLEFSPRGMRRDPTSFESAGPFSPELERTLEALPMPLPPRGAGDAAVASAAREIDWRAIPSGPERSANPALEVSWRRLGAPQPLDTARVHDIPIAARQDTGLVFDFGGTQLGRLVVEYEGPAGSTLDFGWAEELSGQVPAVLQQHGLFTGARHVSAGGASRFQTIKPYGMRYLQLNVSRHAAPLTIHRVGLVRETYPFEARGRFESSDPALDALWQMGERTLRVCAEDSYVDTPFRERGLYAGDLLVQIGVTLATSGDLRLAKRSLRLLRDMYRDLFVPGAPRHPDEIGLLEDYPLLALEALGWVVERTGDLELARELFPDYRRLIDGVLARRGPGGGVTNETVFVEWVLPDSERHGVENTAYHALLARALSSLAALARRLDDAELSLKYEAESRRAASWVAAHFWDAEHGAFIDGTRAGERSASHLPISSAWPSLWGLTTEAQEAKLDGFWQRLFGPGAPRSTSVSPYGGFFMLGALYRQGHVGLAEQFMRRYWAPMLVDPEGTLWEHFDRRSGTSSHAWSAAPTYYLSSEVLGVPLGYPEPSHSAELVIAPRSESLSWARGVVPHPLGDVGVEWRIEGDLLRVSVSVPHGLRYRVEPRGRLSRLRLELNGELASPAVAARAVRR